METLSVFDGGATSRNRPRLGDNETWLAFTVVSIGPLAINLAEHAIGARRTRL
jgi:hypothetical protein